MPEQPSPTIPVLRTERLILRNLVPEDKQEIFYLRSDEEVNKYLDRQLATSIDDASDFIRKIVAGNAFYWAITLKEQNKLLGTICLFGLAEENDTCEIGYELLPGWQGRGLMNEAIKKVIEFAFETLQKNQIFAYTHRLNQNSSRLLIKQNFEQTDFADENDANLIAFQLKRKQ